MSTLKTKQADARDRQKLSASAYANLKRALARDPNNADLLGQQAAAALDLGKRKEAARLLEKSLRPDTNPQIYRRNLNLLVSAAFQEGDHDAARKSLGVPIPKWDAPGAPDRPALAVILSLCRFLATYKMFPAALELVATVRPYIEGDSAALEMLGALHLQVDEPKQAEEALEKARAVGGDRPSLMIARAAAASAQLDFDRALAETKRYVNVAPAVLTTAKRSQRTLIGVTNWRTLPIRNYSTPEGVHFGTSIVGQVSEWHADRYRVFSVFCDSENALKAITQGPKPGLIWNAAVNAEELLQQAAMPRISTLIGIWAAPVINHPENAVLTTRDAAARLYEGIERLTVPGIQRFRKTDDVGAAAAEIESTFGYPVIVRGLVEQQGENAFKADDRTTLEASIRAVEGDEYFYVIKFIENRTELGHYRKIRAAVAGDFIQIVRVDYDESWNVHGRKSAARADWYLSRPSLLADEASICEDADRFFGIPVMDTLRAIRERSPLDVFGIDFDVTPEGKLLLFEANAAMNLLSTAAPSVEHPRGAERRFVKHLGRFIDSVVAARTRATPL